MKQEAITRAVFDYLGCLVKGDSGYEDPGEWNFDLEEKFNAVYDTCWTFLGFPSLAEINQSPLTIKQIADMTKKCSLVTGELASEYIFEVLKVFTNKLDFPVEEKARLLALITTQKESLPMYHALKMANDPDLNPE